MCIRVCFLSCLCVAIGSFIKFCGDLLTPELTRRLMLPLDSALAQISGYVLIHVEHNDFKLVTMNALIMYKYL